MSTHASRVVSWEDAFWRQQRYGAGRRSLPLPARDVLVVEMVGRFRLLGAASDSVGFVAGGYRPLRVIDHHALTIADCFVMLKTLKRGDELTVLTYEADPASGRTVRDILLTPDAYAELYPAEVRLSAKG